jgi:hypothetical protein
MVTGFQGFEVPNDKYHVITTPLVTGSGAVDVFIAEDRFALVATGPGVDIVDLFSGEVISSGVIGGTSTTSVTADFVTAFGNMYVGTDSAGVYSAQWSSVRIPGTDFSGLLTQVYTTASSPPISANQINDLATIPFRLLISTGAGVDYLVDQVHTVLRATRSLISGSNACQLTAAEEGYWTATNSGVEASYGLAPFSGTGIILPDFGYNAVSSVPLLPSHVVTDIAVSEGSPNLLSFATSAGDFVIEEQQGSEATSLTKSLRSAEAVVSVAFSDAATFDSGTEYTASEDSVEIFGLVDNTTSGTHFYEISSEDRLTKENTRDQALVTGTITVIRTTGVA